jgi:hypothetical protein
MTYSVRLLALLSAVLCAVLLASPAFAQRRGVDNLVVSPTPHPTQTLIRFAGQVSGVLGPDASPTGITLRLQGDQKVTVRFAPRTILKARSAEAQVEGLMVGDFAVVQVVRANVDWSARRVFFDVDPFGPIRFFTVTGSVVRLNRAGTQVLLALPGGTTRWIIITRNTHYSIDGVSTEAAPVLERSTVLQVDVHKVPRGWVAISVNVKTVRNPAQSHRATFP